MKISLVSETFSSRFSITCGMNYLIRQRTTKNRMKNAEIFLAVHKPCRVTKVSGVFVKRQFRFVAELSDWLSHGKIRKEGHRFMLVFGFGGAPIKINSPAQRSSTHQTTFLEQRHRVNSHSQTTSELCVDVSWCVGVNEWAGVLNRRKHSINKIFQFEC